MADPTAFYEPTEDELLSSLAVPVQSYNPESDADEYRRLQELEQHAYAQQQLMVAEQEQEQLQALEQVPEDVKRFLVLFHQAILENDLPTITNMYESGWNKLTQAHYSQNEWPEAELISPLVGNDQVFLTLYRELYFRHVYAKLQPTIDDRFQSYENIYSDGPVPLDLPIQWLWDMLDEFVYQFSNFSTWRANPKNKNEEELEALAEAQNIWSSYSVLNVLYSLVQKSQINEQLRAEKQGKTPEEVQELAGEYGSKPLYRNLGYFSLICLLRVHVLLGDPTLALQTMENVDLSGGAFLTRITACHVTTYYHVGCAYMALGRWPDAIKTFISVLIFFIRMKQYHTRSYQYGSITKQCERMYALLAICTTLSPGPSDESIMSIVKEHYADQLSVLQRGGDEALETFKDLFLSASPKYLNVNPPPYEDPSALESYLANPPIDATQRHLDLFLSDVVAVRGVSNIRNLLKLYTSIDASKLVTFSEGETEEEEILQQLMVLKAASRTYAKGQQQDTLLDGERIVTNNLDFTIDGSMVHVEETTSHRRYAGFFIRNAEHAQRVFNTIKSSPLPIQRKPTTSVTQTTTDNKNEPKKSGAWQPKRARVAAQ
ncbi:eukaryotic translation initiation factor 3 subunit L [Kwoniella mangroviensis CBS 10435]|uniref:Eukaryotic translation initiation factor 3 subunit L n=1 Tax=Kwoniella mangroviensis CBS 10435 TaxID=1331196 RepID=A0A1B9IZP1_9TREE|nr:eukaryotic translation initiation factor 3 subunit L [Kwoniella mangroviensis CBS 8507]OCF60998.1 eukaryotic translation initiation factor 3 subunit L [Kwoniella mangroviensis CBS 10435]OCF66597.1 eukaryotic translation initiation factor 3 subunit L [Kwoniella mangroviensis CBS 8507]OCF74254.1 eukaryotic translation initiation factor 3 subunit L [Kwoniella mangroviensis CBS 8886]